MNLPLRIAIRFLFRSRSDRPLTLFTFISIFGITLSVLLFLLIDTVMNGFSQKLGENLIGFDAPLTIDVAAADATNIREHLKNFSAAHPEFKLVSSESREFYGFLQEADDKPMGIKARTMNREFFELKNGALHVDFAEGFDAANFLTRDDAILVGKDIAQNLQYAFGLEGPLQLIHPFADLGPSGELEPRSKPFVVAGTFATGYYEVDNFYVFIPDGALTGFANTSLMPVELYLYPGNISDAEAVKALWQKNYPDDPIKTWLDKNQPLFRAMRLERLVFVILFILLVVIACLNLASVIRIFGMSKIRDAAILRSLGATMTELRRIFWGIGLLLGTAGGVFGVGIGLTLVTIFEHQGILLPQAYELSELPLRLNPATIVGLLVGAPLISAMVAFYPARRIAKETITDVLRLT